MTSKHNQTSQTDPEPISQDVLLHKVKQVCTLLTEEAENGIYKNVKSKYSIAMRDLLDSSSHSSSTSSEVHELLVFEHRNCVHELLSKADASNKKYLASEKAEQVQLLALRNEEKERKEAEKNKPGVYEQSKAQGKEEKLNNKVAEVRTREEVLEEAVHEKRESAQHYIAFMTKANAHWDEYHKLEIPKQLQLNDRSRVAALETHLVYTHLGDVRQLIQEFQALSNLGFKTENLKNLPRAIALQDHILMQEKLNHTSTRFKMLKKESINSICESTFSKTDKAVRGEMIAFQQVQKNRDLKMAMKIQDLEQANEDRSSEKANEDRSSKKANENRQIISQQSLQNSMNERMEKLSMVAFVANKVEEFNKLREDLNEMGIKLNHVELYHPPNDLWSRK